MLTGKKQAKKKTGKKRTLSESVLSACEIESAIPTECRRAGFQLGDRNRRMGTKCFDQKKSSGKKWRRNLRKESPGTVQLTKR